MDKKFPLISVIIPAYNEEKYLGKCLKAIRKQTFKNYELIVVDNNSKDKTAEIAKNFGARVVMEKKQGIVSARERGFQEAKAEIIARTDADTVVPEDWLDKIYAYFKNHPEVVAITGPVFKPKNIAEVLGYFYQFIAEKIFSLFIGQPSLLGPNMALRKSVWKKTKVCDSPDIIEDYDLSYHLSGSGKILFIRDLNVTGSARKILNNPLRGIYLYLFVYGINFYKNVKLHS